MRKNIFTKLFNKNIKEKEGPLTIINSKRENAIIKQRLICQKNERQKTCLSKYFEDIKGLNTIERNLYYQIKF